MQLNILQYTGHSLTTNNYLTKMSTVHRLRHLVFLDSCCSQYGLWTSSLLEVQNLKPHSDSRHQNLHFWQDLLLIFMYITFRNTSLGHFRALLYHGRSPEFKLLCSWVFYSQNPFLSHLIFSPQLLTRTAFGLRITQISAQDGIILNYFTSLHLGCLIGK